MIRQFKNFLFGTLPNDSSKYYNGSGQFTIPPGTGADPNLTYLTDADETADLPNSRALLAGTNITFDDSTPGERTINASAAGSQIYSLRATFDGGGSAPTASSKVRVSAPVTGTIVGVRLLSDVAGSAVVDIWKDTYANYPPTIADTITAAAKPTLTASDKYNDITLTGWTTAVTAGDTFIFNLDSASTLTWLVCELLIQP